MTLKKWGWRDSPWGLPPKICICFLLWNHTHSFHETWPQTLAPVMYESLFTALKTGAQVSTISPAEKSFSYEVESLKACTLHSVYICIYKPSQFQKKPKKNCRSWFQSVWGLVLLCNKLSRALTLKNCPRKSKFRYALQQSVYIIFSQFKKIPPKIVGVHKSELMKRYTPVH